MGLQSCVGPGISTHLSPSAEIGVQVVHPQHGAQEIRHASFHPVEKSGDTDKQGGKPVLAYLARGLQPWDSGGTTLLRQLEISTYIQFTTREKPQMQTGTWTATSWGPFKLYR